MTDAATSLHAADDAPGPRSKDGRPAGRPAEGTAASSISWQLPWIEVQDCSLRATAAPSDVDLLSTGHPVLLALLGGTLTWGATALGAAAVFLARDVSRRMLDAMLGFAAGMMVSACSWSLLVPALALGEGGVLPAWMPATIGFLLGSAFLWSVHRSLPHLHVEPDRLEGPPSHLGRTTLLFLAITLHNLPEGIAVGVAFAAAAADVPGASTAGAVALTLGMAIQDIPEGLALSLPLRREGLTPGRSFFYGQLSGVVEPLGALVGAVAIGVSHAILPYALGFAAGAMMFVVIEELIPEAQAHGDTTAPTIGALIGFVLMMVLDTGLG